MDKKDNEKNATESLYELTQTVLKADTDSRKESQRKLLSDKVVLLLKGKDYQSIDDALRKMRDNNQVDAWMILDQIAIEVVNHMIVVDSKTLETIETFFFVIPICLTGVTERVRLPKFSELESFITEKMADNGWFNPDEVELCLNPKIYSEETISMMNLSRWFMVHENLAENYRERREKGIYHRYVSNSVEIGSPKNIYLTGIFKSRVENGDASVPTYLLGDEYISAKEKKAFSQEIQDFLISKNPKDENIDNSLIVVGLEPLGLIMYEAFQIKQEYILHSFVNKYKDNDIVFILLDVEGYNDLALLAFDEEQDVVVGNWVVSNYSVTKDYNVDKIMDKVGDVDKVIYIGKTPIALDDAYASTFSLKKYSESNEVERFVPEYVDIDDFGF